MESDQTTSPVAVPPPLPPGPLGSAPEAEPLPKPVLRPTFLNCLRGVFRLSWKAQLTWRRLLLGLIGILVIPALVYLTTATPEGWRQRRSTMGDPHRQVAEFARRLERAGMPLAPDKREALDDIFSEEYARAEREAHSSELSEASVESQKQAIKACHDRIRPRVQAILTERQFGRFQSFQQRVMVAEQGDIREPRWGRTGPFYHWLIDLYFFVVLPLQCVRAAGALIRDEIQADTLGFLVTRPVSRARLLLAKFASQTAWIQLVLALETLLVLLAGALRQIPDLGTLLPLLLGAQVLAVMAWSALGTCLGQVTGRYMALAIVYGLVVELGIGRIPTNINTLSLMRHLKGLLARNPALQGVFDWTATGVLVPVGALALATCLFLTVAALLFTFREYHRTAEMQK